MELPLLCCSCNVTRERCRHDFVVTSRARSTGLRDTLLIITIRLSYVCVFRTRSIGTISTRDTSTTRCQCRSGLSDQSRLSELTSNDPRVSPFHRTSVLYPLHVISSYGTPYPAPSSTVATIRHPRLTDSTSSTTVSTGAAGADHFSLGGVAPFFVLYVAMLWGKVTLGVLWDCS